mmetsp:Transcript_68582/g.194312  ORF Transcript_68582/g.194312 Transcript_68582/m.194312 type:complete len:82 (+) Transcript_68582:89-334(+)|eukprot:CAMPEP_0168414554 /NCGR_PEP_ID=MMETSP0228-20121227/29782_1 /TAXON_ID=133427 /ORGANISM="Protoceratium reticulatum, Strain CCCM 535 (=CCMP 1889)" /LENGTH=81 /DNA_ID=CAMNT_0008428347 /DNA_START=21 /DNA_END=266 /DNA_ORIENTATION=-
MERDDCCMCGQAEKLGRFAAGENFRCFACIDEHGAAPRARAASEASSQASSQSPEPDASLAARQGRKRDSRGLLKPMPSPV